MFVSIHRRWPPHILPCPKILPGLFSNHLIELGGRQWIKVFLFIVILNCNKEFCELILK